MKNVFFQERLKTLKALASILGFAGIATACVSLVTTASGLSAFLPEPWQAFLISTAIQFPLFAINLKYAELWHTIQTKARWILPIFIALLLSVSSTFSFVYMAGTAYPKSVFIEDAERILDTTIYEHNLDLNETLKDEVASLSNSDSIISDYLTDLDSYTPEATSFIDTSETISSLEVHNDLQGISQTLKKLSSEPSNEAILLNLKKSIASLQAQLKDNIAINQKNIDALYDSIDFLDQRLEPIDHTESIYKSIAGQRETNLALIQTYTARNEEYQTELSLLENVSSLAENYNNDNNSHLRTSINSIREFLLAEDFNADDLISEAENVHKCLLESNVSPDHTLLKEYDTFLRQITLFAETKSTQKSVENELLELQNRSTEIVSNGISDYSNTQELSTWRTYWHTRIVALRNTLKSIPSEALANSHYSIKSRGELIVKLDSMERLYLSDLNLFEKAWTILIGAHRYKILVIFCLVLALTFDLTALGAGAIIFLYKDGLRIQYREEPIRKSSRAS